MGVTTRKVSWGKNIPLNGLFTFYIELPHVIILMPTENYSISHVTVDKLTTFVLVHTKLQTALFGTSIKADY